MESEKLTDAEKIRFAKSQYQKEWRRKNREKCKRSENKYWLRRFEQLQSQVSN